jgi:tetratricopeptide (TPR) repeat protein
VSVFEAAVRALHEGLSDWNRGAVPGLVSRAAMLFDESARAGDVRAGVGSAVARGLAGDLDGARRRLHELIAQTPDCAAGYVALGLFGLRDPDPIAQAAATSWALIAARDLAPGVACIERMLAQSLSTAGEFMTALQSARNALALDPDDDEARLWSAMLRLHFGGDVTAASVLIEGATEGTARGRSPAVWLAAVAGHYARAEFHEARKALRKAVAPLRVGANEEAPLVDAARRWFRELRGFGPGVSMAGERWLRDVGGSGSDYVRTRSALAAFREAIQQNPGRAQAERVSALEVDGVLGELEARTRRGMLEWGSKLIIRGFAEAYLPLVAYLEPPPLEVLAAMELVVIDG